MKALNRWPIIAFVAFLALCTRRLDQLLVPQFYAEDGTVFFIGGATTPFSIFAPVASYLNLGARLVALLFAPLPWEYQPVAYAVGAAGITALTAAYVWASALPSALRWVGAAAVVAVPTMGEPFLNICCLHFILAVPIATSLLGPAPQNWRRAALLALCALSGPEVLVLLPLSLWTAWRWRGSSTGRWTLGILWACAAAQILTMLSTPRADLTHVLPPLLLVRLYAKVFFWNWGTLTPDQGWWLAGLAAATVLVLAWRNKHWAAAMIIALTALAFLMAGRSVAVGWPNPFGNGARYAYLPFLFCIWALAFLAAGVDWRRRWVAVLMLSLVAASSGAAWAGQIPKNQKWAQQVAEARAGTRQKFSIPWGGGLVVEVGVPR